MAAKEKTTIDTQGLTGKLSFEDEGAPSSRETIVEQPDASVLGRLTIVQDLKASADAKKYKTPFQK